MGQIWKKKKLLVVVPLQHQGQRHGWSITAVWRLMCPCLVQTHLFCQISIESKLTLVWVRPTRLAIHSLCCLSAADFWSLASWCTWRHFSCCLFLLFFSALRWFSRFPSRIELLSFVFSWVPFTWWDRFFVLISSVLRFGGFQHPRSFFSGKFSLHQVTLLRFVIVSKFKSHWFSLRLLLR